MPPASDEYADLPDWCRRERRVADCSGFGLQRVEITTVDRISPTQIVLANTSRYSRKTLRPVGNYYGGELRAADDPDVIDKLAADILFRACLTIYKIRFERKGGYKAVCASLDKIEKIIQNARRSVENLSGGQSRAR